MGAIGYPLSKSVPQRISQRMQMKIKEKRPSFKEMPLVGWQQSWLRNYLQLSRTHQFNHIGNIRAPGSIHSFYISFRSYIHSCTRPFVFSFTDSFIHPSIRPCLHSCMHACMHSSFIRPFVVSLLSSFLNSLIHSFVRSLIHSFPQSLHSFLPAIDSLAYIP